MKEAGEIFSEEETNSILKEVPLDSLPKYTLGKLKRLNIDEYYTIVSRNLALLIKRQE